MERVELRTETRTTLGKQVRQLRARGWIPAVMYGPDQPAKAIQAQERSLYKTLQTAGSTALINLFVDKAAKPHVVLAREIQRDPLTGSLQHVDFYQVRLTEKVRTMPRLEFHGESPLIRAAQAVIIHNMNEVEVECLPTDLISSIPVDVSVLQTLDDNVLVRDLPVPPNVTILADPDDVVVSVVQTRIAIKEEAEEELVTEAEAAVEVEAQDEAED